MVDTDNTRWTRPGVFHKLSTEDLKKSELDVCHNQSQYIRSGVFYVSGLEHCRKTKFGI